MTNDDRKLLEDAAMVAGLCWIEPTADGMPWNPLTDDGDALRLAVKLDIQVYPFEADSVSAAVQVNARVRLYEHHNSDPNAATRRAITRVAAEIWRSKA